MLSFNVNTIILLAFLYFLGHANYVFNGVSDTANEGTWVCAGTGQTIATATGPGTGGPLFHITQPNSYNGDQDCGAGKRVEDFFLTDEPCSESLYFLCEKP